jgi:antitoxin component YwqK of YwqJK toxin-antitoxin module/Tfp pilus assembly protein PilF
MFFFLRVFIPVLAILLPFNLFSQKISLIKSGEVIEQGKQLYDSGRYEASALKLLTVPKRDTNYVYMLSELALTYTADKKYDQAIEVCNEALKMPSEFGSHLWKSKGIAADRKGDFESSVKFFQDALSKYPFDHSLIFNLGITYYNHRDYQKAEDCFFRALAINPFHASSHLNLAKMAMGRGRKTHAAFAMGMYLSLSHLDNDRLVLMNKFFGNEITDEGSIPADGANNGEKLDQIIKSGIAMDKKFNSKIPIDAPVVKQYELLFNQLALVSSSLDDKYANYYLPIFKAIGEKGLVETFIYYILSSSSNEIAKKWLKKNEKPLNQFFELANKEMKEKRRKISVPDAFGYKEPIEAWYDNSNRLDAIGKMGVGEKKMGQWFYFHNSYEKSAEGKYNEDGKKAGVWKYYYADGRLKSLENYDTGEITVYYPEGEKKEHFFMPNDQIAGEAQTYYRCGQLREKLNYRDGKREGMGESFSAKGTKTAAYTYKNNLLDGEYITYYPTGEIQSKKQFTGGVLNGNYREYYTNGKIQTSGEFVKDQRSGIWKFYFSNGQLEKSGSYAGGISTGEWVFFESDGSVSEKRNFDLRGNWHGENTFYDGGKKSSVKTFKNDVLIKQIFYDKAEKELGRFESSNGTFAAKTFYANGPLAGEGRYKKGKMDGPWIYYYPDGNKWREFNYADGLIRGEAAEYFRNGAKKFLSTYKDNRYHGYFQEFYKNGHVKQEGWFQDGQRQQQWLTYHINGELESDYYYMNDELDGPNLDHNILGKLYSTTTYKNGEVEGIEEYNSTGTKITSVKTTGTRQTYETKYASGKPKATYEVQCGHYNGRISVLYPNGKTFYSYDLINGRKQGDYKQMTIDGIPDWAGKFEDGQEVGIWTSYSPVGKLESIGKFANGQRDSVTNFFYNNGKTSSNVLYRYGEREGITKIFSPDGTPILEKNYELGQMVAYRVFVNGKAGEWLPAKKEMAITVTNATGDKVYEEHFKNGLIEGAKKVYFDNGKLYSEYNFADGDREGVYTIYYSNGKVAEKGEYKNDEFNAVRKFYKEDGKILKSEEYLFGARHGSTLLYNNGAKAGEVLFWAGSPEK